MAKREKTPKAAIASVDRLRDGHKGPRDLGDGLYEPMGEAVARVVRDAIVDRRLAPGAAIRQEALAEHLGTSKIPVREALQQLEREGFVTLVPHSGARVARLDLAEHIEIYRIREALEPMLLADSVPGLSDAQLDELASSVARIGTLADDHVAWMTADRDFHLATYAAAAMPRLSRIVTDFWTTTQQYRRAHMAIWPREKFERVHLEHLLILDALQRRDSVDAEQRLRSHIRATRLELTARPEVFGSAAQSTDTP